MEYEIEYPNCNEVQKRGISFEEAPCQCICKECEEGEGMKNIENCHYCEFVKFESDDVDDRNKLMYKKPFVQFYDLGLYINGPELLTVKYGIGYFNIIKRTNIEFCPMCGVNFKESEME